LPQLEERILSDSVLYEELLIAEDELIDENKRVQNARVSAQSG
jgi:hypothetical protein